MMMMGKSKSFHCYCFQISKESGTSKSGKRSSFLVTWIALSSFLSQLTSLKMFVLMC